MKSSLAQQLEQISNCAQEPGTNLERLLLESLLIQALEISGADYAIVLSPAGKGAYSEQFVKLGAAVKRDKFGEIQVCHDTLNNRRPDPMIHSVMRLKRGVRGKPSDIGLPLCLPGSHPSIRYFLILPMDSGNSGTSVLFVANPFIASSSYAEDELMAKLIELIDVLARHRQKMLEKTSYQENLFNVGNSASNGVSSEDEQLPEMPDKTVAYLQQFQAIANVAPVGLVQLSASWTCDYANDVWCQLSGLSLSETMGEGWVDALHAEDVVNALMDLRESLSKNRVFSRNIRLQRAAEILNWVRLSATATQDDQGKFDGCLLVILDITEAQLADERRQYALTHDDLTGLINRSAFLDKLQERLNQRQTRISTALLYLDLDSFKTINDTLGHDCGDELLINVARRLESTVGPENICARYDGDEFTIILTGSADTTEICNLAESIVRNFHEPFRVFDNELHLSVSIGVALSDDRTSSSDFLLSHADTALQKAKSTGRSRWIVYTREFQHEDIQRSALEARVRRATERQEFTLVYQPQFKIDDESIVSFEALLRWAPSDIPVPEIELLVSVLEDNGLINDVGQWVLEAACIQFRQWEDMGLLDDGCMMSVNVSPSQLGLANFVSRLDGILDRCGMAAHQLNLEITESALIEKNSSCIRVINEIKEMGVQLSLDDFGTGYASLSYLTRLPIDFLKIDKSFVMAMHDDEPSRTIVMSVLAMAGTLNIDVIAEGIEDERTMIQLRDAKCRFGQGFYVSKPLSAALLEPVLVRKQMSFENLVMLA